MFLQIMCLYCEKKHLLHWTWHNLLKQDNIILNILFGKKANKETKDDVLTNDTILALFFVAAP